MSEVSTAHKPPLSVPVASPAANASPTDTRVPPLSVGPAAISHAQAYWLCQVAGWLLYGGFLAVMYLLNDRTKLGLHEGLSIFFLCLFGLLYTHGFRLLIHRYGWAQWPLPRLVPLILLANVGMSVGFVSSMYGTERLLGLQPPGVIDLGVIYVMLINSTFIFFMWSLMYFAAYFFLNYKKKEIERLEWERAMREFELNQLRSQLNPHFVFNALNTIRALVAEDPSKAQQSITQLSNLLRHSLLATRRRTIPLEEEMRTVRDYLMLEKLRYEDRMHLTFDIDASALTVCLPPMMVQTLVENAVKHGIARQKAEGFIALKGRVHKGWLHLTIRNSGTLATPGDTTGFGVRNTRQRLQLLYGQPDLFTLHQEGTHTVVAQLQIPLQP